MNRFLFISTGLFLFSNRAIAQDIKFAGTHPPDTAIVILVKQYMKAAYNFKTVAERDAARKPFTSTGYFYHGMDGAPVSTDSLTKRQTNNQFQKLSDSLFSFTLFQYESTAILSYRNFEKGLDKGKPYQGTGSWLIVMSKESGRWKVVADVIGQDPPTPRK